MGMRPEMRAVIFREDQYWLAQILEHDLGVQADNLKDLVTRLSVALEAEAPSMARLAPAPKYFQDLWGRRAGDFYPTCELGVNNLTFGLIA